MKLQDDKSLIFISGPCVLENMDITREIAKTLKEISVEHGLRLIFKASFDKANRTSIRSYRGPGIEKGLQMLSQIKNEFQLEITTDIHTPDQAQIVKDVVDVIQIPAFLSRQTDMIVEAAKTGRIINIKKAQFMSPYDMKYAIEKAKDAGAKEVWITERGTMFGYNNLIVDFRSLIIMRDYNCPIIFDATHSAQLPGGGGSCSSGNREFAFALAKAAVAVGVDGIFMEVHPDPDKALCDGPNSIKLCDVKYIINTLLKIQNASN